LIPKWRMVISMITPRTMAAWVVLTVLLAPSFILARTSLRISSGHKRIKLWRHSTFGRINVSTHPGGLPIFINDISFGQTTETERALNLSPGTYTVKIILPNSTPWSRTLNIVAGRKNCIDIFYIPYEINIPYSLLPKGV